MSEGTAAARAGRLERILARVIEGWALLGGLVLTAVVLVNVWTVLGGLVGLPFAGDFEITQMAVAAAAFMFLPWCQLTGQNVTADIFTARASARTRRRLGAVGSALALGFAALLTWRMWLGMVDQKTYGLASAILQVPVWWVYLPILASLILLAAAAAVTLRRQLSGTAEA